MPSEKSGKFKDQNTSIELISNKIQFIRGKPVMMDQDLAKLYGVPTKVLLRAVKRNLKRFPSDFMCQLTQKELVNLRSRIGTSSWGGRRYLPYVFTEQGVAMLSSVLNSEKAIQVNIEIMRAFVVMKRMSLTYAALSRKIQEMEKKYDVKFKVVFEVIEQIILEMVNKGQQTLPQKKNINFDVN